MQAARTLVRAGRIARPLTHTTRRLNQTASNARNSDRVPVNDPNAPRDVSPVSSTNTVPVSKMGIEDGTLVESVESGESQRQMQAPNRQKTWSRSQQPRDRAMSGPRFEQTIMANQPQPQAAIDLVHKQPVRWTDSHVVECNGGGGPLGHPRIFVNVDKPQICWCTYCGTPFAHNHHRKYLESLPNTTYPLEPSNDPAAVDEPQRVTDEAFAQR